MFKNKRILFLSPHPDDVEYYCGGTLIKLIEQGNEVTVIAFSDCRESVPNGFPDNILETEFLNSMKKAGIEKFEMKEIPVRRFNEYRQDILEYLVLLNKIVTPDIVFMPSILDTHQDHEVIRKEAIRAFKDRCLISYEVPLNSFDSSFNIVIELTEEQMNKKLELIKCYKSQEHRIYSKENYIKNRAEIAGSYINKQYAELFKIIKWIE